MNLFAIIPWYVRWAAFSALMLACVAFGAVKMHGHDESRYDALQAKYDTFVAQTKAQGEKSKAEAAQRTKDEQTKKENADAEHTKSIAALNARISQLRSARSGSSFLAPASPEAVRPDVVTFDRAELERALRSLDLGLQSLVDEGSAAVVDLDTAKKWAQ